jgi:hypothetical protein
MTPIGAWESGRATCAAWTPAAEAPPPLAISNQKSRLETKARVRMP